MHDNYIPSLCSLVSVAIIGGSDTVDQRAYNRSRIVRVNDHFPRQGGPCDVLFIRPNSTNLLPMIEAVRTLEPFAIVLALAHGKHIKELAKVGSLPCPITTMMHGGNAPIEHGDIEHYWVESFFREWDFTPLTGVLAVEYFRRMCPSEIFVTGMDLYAGDNVDKKGAHDLRQQARYLAHVAKHDRRVQLDSTLENSLQRFDLG